MAKKKIDVGLLSVRFADKYIKARNNSPFAKIKRLQKERDTALAAYEKYWTKYNELSNAIGESFANFMEDVKIFEQNEIAELNNLAVSMNDRYAILSLFDEDE